MTRGFSPYSDCTVSAHMACWTDFVVTILLSFQVPRAAGSDFNLTSAPLKDSHSIPRRLRIFLCHSSGDKEEVRGLYKRLTLDGFDAWLDEEDLLPGDEWQSEIPKAVRRSDVVIVCLSKQAIDKAGYVQKEIKFALDTADEQPEGATFLVPLKLEECTVPERLGRWQWVNYYDAHGYARLVEALHRRANKLGRTVQDACSGGDNTLPPSVNVPNTGSSQVVFRDKEYFFVPPGDFVMGSLHSHLTEIAGSYEDDSIIWNEYPAHQVSLDSYYISRFPVTNAEFQRFIDETDRAVPFHDNEFSESYNWNRQTRRYPEGKGHHPVVLVSWHDARAYCDWLGARLPTETEWEKAARGTDAREWPWGNIWHARRCNAEGSGTSPVGRFSPLGDSPYGLSDMAGNIWEWCSSLPEPYPYRADDGREILDTPGPRVLRGGSFGSGRLWTRCALRNSADPYDRGFSIGFRVVLSKTVQTTIQAV